MLHVAPPSNVVPLVAARHCAGGGNGRLPLPRPRNSVKHASQLIHHPPPAPSRLPSRPRRRRSLVSLNLPLAELASFRLMKLFTPLLAVALAAIPAALGQDDVPILYDLEHNATTIIGTWSSGSRKVVTGAVSAVWSSQGFAGSSHAGIREPCEHDLHLSSRHWRVLRLVSRLCRSLGLGY